MALRLVMMGTGPFALPSFRALYTGGHHVLALVTQPTRAAEGRRAAAESPLRAVARQHRTPIWEPERINQPAAYQPLAALAPDLLVVADYGQILKPEVLATAHRGGVNVHGSLLPKYRGAAPVQWALWHGETETGVTVIQMTAGLDAGPCLAQMPTPIGPEESAAELEPRLAALGAQLLLDTLARLERGTLTGQAQDLSQASRAPRLKKSDGRIDWHRTASEIHNQVRALEPWPRTYTYWQRTASEPLRLVLGRVRVAHRAAASEAPAGTVLEATGDCLRVATGAGALDLLSLQPAGKRLLSAAEFLRGYPLRAGQRLGPTDPPDPT